MAKKIDHFFAEYRPIIEEELKRYLDFHITDSRQQIKDAILYSVTAKAKRIRPLLSIATFQLFSSDIEKILPLASAIELVHSYSLIHDDLPAMDNDDFRRGRPTCHKEFGEDMAILAGDILNTFAFELLATELPKHYSAEKTIITIRELSQAFGINGMAGGQVLDLLGTAELKDQDYLSKTHSLKTGAVISSCITVPGLLENASEPTLLELKTLGHNIGLLFQIVDDILDVKSSKETLGKSPNKDQEQNKLTYVSLWGLEEAERIAKDTASQAKDALHTIQKLEQLSDSTVLEDLIDYILTRTD